MPRVPRLAQPKGPHDMTAHEKNFYAIYVEKLAEQIRKRPDQYAYTADHAPEVARKMTAALKRGTGNKDSLAIRQTCRELSIAYRYKDILEYLNN
jgi:hypothetical protein